MYSVTYLQLKPDPESKPSLQEIMKKGREARKTEEQREVTENSNSSAGGATGETTERTPDSGQREATQDSNVSAGVGQREATAGRTESGSDSDDDPMLIAGLSEVVGLRERKLKKSYAPCYIFY